MNRTLVLSLVGTAVVAGLIATNWEYLYEELIVDPLGEASLLTELSLKPSPCEGHEIPAEYVTNFDYCYEYLDPEGWAPITYKQGQFEALSSPAFMDALDTFPDESFVDEGRWDHFWDHTLEFEVYDARTRYGPAATLTAYVEANRSLYQNPLPIVFSDVPAIRAIEKLPNEPEHEVILVERKGKLLIVRIGASDFDRTNRPTVDAVLASFRFLPEFGIESQ